jgi:hypothetical protein
MKNLSKFCYRSFLFSHLFFFLLIFFIYLLTTTLACFFRYLPFLSVFFLFFSFSFPFFLTAFPGFFLTLFCFAFFPSTYFTFSLSCYRYIKSENEELKETVDKLSSELTTANQELSFARNQLNVVKDELSVAFVELKATEDIVKEQNLTEIELRKAIKELEKIIFTKTEEMSILLVKVTTLEKQEETRLQQNSSFSSVMENHSISLSKMIYKLMNDSDASSSLIISGITEMLNKGNTTCNSLKGSIETALKVLINDTKKSKEEMNSSCDSMKNEIQKRENNFVQKMENVMNGLNGYFNENSSKINDIQALLTNQTQQVSVFFLLSYFLSYLLILFFVAFLLRFYSFSPFLFLSTIDERNAAILSFFSINVRKRIFYVC